MPDMSSLGKLVFRELVHVWSRDLERVFRIKVIQDSLLVEWKPYFLKEDNLRRMLLKKVREIVFVSFKSL